MGACTTVELRELNCSALGSICTGKHGSMGQPNASGTFAEVQRRKEVQVQTIERRRRYNRTLKELARHSS